jgi:hypothetical protein
MVRERSRYDQEARSLLQRRLQLAPTIGTQSIGLNFSSTF